MIRREPCWQRREVVTWQRAWQPCVSCSEFELQPSRTLHIQLNIMELGASPAMSTGLCRVTDIRKTDAGCSCVLAQCAERLWGHQASSTLMSIPEALKHQGGHVGALRSLYFSEGRNMGRATPPPRRMGKYRSCTHVALPWADCCQGKGPPASAIYYNYPGSRDARNLMTHAPAKAMARRPAGLSSDGAARYRHQRKRLQFCCLVPVHDCIVPLQFSNA